MTSGEAKVAATAGAEVAATGGARVAATGGAEVAATGGARVAATGGAEVAATGGAEVAAAGGTEVAATGGVRVAATGGAEVAATGGAEVAATGGTEVASTGGARASAIVEAFRQVLARCEGFRLRIQPAAVLPEHRLVEDLGADSVALLDLAVGLEAMLGRAVDEEALARLGTVGAIADYLAGTDGAIESQFTGPGPAGGQGG